MSAAETTTDHDVIRKLIEHRKGKASAVKATEDNGQSGGLLRVDFRDHGDKLAFLHQDETADGKTSRFTKFIARDKK